MKRLLILMIAVMMAAGVMAEEVIPQNFNGVRLGLSSRKDVERILTSNGLVFDTDNSDSLNYIYTGKCKHEEMEFDYIATRYYMDTLVLIGYFAHCDSACNDYGKAFIQRIHSKYNDLQSCENSLYYALNTSGADSLGLSKWGRRDDKSLVVTLHNDSSCACLYFSEDRMITLLANALSSALRVSNPDYAEENKVTGVAGVKFGDSRESVKRVIETKSSQILESDSHHIIFSKTKVGGITYSYAEFYFLPGRGLVAVNLSKSFYSWQEEEAKAMFDNLVAQYKSKYTNLKENDEGTYAFCGAYTDDYKDMPPIVISRKKSLSRGGDMMYYVDVNYYLNNISGLYNDEI